MTKVQRPLLLLLGTLLALLLLHPAEGHGYLSQPASRNAAFRCGFPSAPPNYDLNGLSAGGPATVRGARLGNGVCGDIITGSQPHLEGGNNAPKIITARYRPNEPFDIEVDLTAFHYGHFEFFLCVQSPKGSGENWSKKTTQACLEEHHLLRADRPTEHRYVITSGRTGHYKMSYMMPNVECDRCVLQWYYQTANSGCSVSTEEFWNCADISVRQGEASVGPTQPAPPACFLTPTFNTSQDNVCWNCPRVYDGSINNPNPCKSSGSSPPVVISYPYQGSYLALPKSRSDQAYSQKGNDVGPCDASSPSPSPAAVSRGQTLSLKWPRNDFSGGVVRLAWAPTSQSGSASSFDAGVQEYVCYERACSLYRQCKGDLSGGCPACEVEIKVPAHLPDGSYTLQWAWYGGGSTSPLKPFYSCVDYQVSGGAAVITPKANPLFFPGDASLPDSCYVCSTCDKTFRGGPTLATLQEQVPTPDPASTPAPTTSAPPSTVQTCSGMPNGVYCAGDCTGYYFQCSGGVKFPNQPVALGTDCKGNKIVLASECSNYNPPPTTPAPTTSVPTSGPTSTPAPTTPVPVPTQPKPTPNNGQPGGQTCLREGVNCSPGNCCRQYHMCVGATRYPAQSVAAGTLCYDGQLILESDPRCAGVPCQDPAEVDPGKPVPFCGDGTCDSGTLGESCTSCPGDCGACPSPACGDGVCSRAETCASCAQDCGACQVPKGTSPPSPNPGVPSGDPAGKRMIGYFTNWAQYRTGGGNVYRFVPENIDAKLYTHLCYGFAYVGGDYKMREVEWNDLSTEWSPGLYERFHTHVRARNPQIKTLISVGGWNFNAQAATSSIFTTMVASPTHRATFIASAIAWCRKYGFDGVDLDWEYPGVDYQGGRPQDKANFVTLLEEFRAQINAEQVPAGRSRLLLTIAVGVSPATVAAAYDIAKIHPSLDWIGLMTYDLAGSWDPQTGAHTALTGGSLNLQQVVSQWAALAPSQKLILGLATYGRTWTLSSASNHGMGAPAGGAGPAQVYTGEKGFAAYYEITRAGLTSVYDAATKTMYGYKDQLWVSYDNEATLREKVDFAFARDLGGVMLWAVDLDDFTAGNPLTTSVAQRLFAPVSSPQRLAFGSSVSLDAASQVLAAYPQGSVRILGTFNGGQASEGEVDTVYYVVVETDSAPKSASELASDFAGEACQNPDVSSAGEQDCSSSASSLVVASPLATLLSSLLLLLLFFVC